MGNLAFSSVFLYLYSEIKQPYASCNACVWSVAAGAASSPSAIGIPAAEFGVGSASSTETAIAAASSPSATAELGVSKAISTAGAGRGHAQYLTAKQSVASPP